MGWATCRWIPPAVVCLLSSACFMAHEPDPVFHPDPDAGADTDVDADTDGDGDTDVDGDTDGDGDTDIDGDTDVDGDTDGDTDSDTGTDVCSSAYDDPVEEVLLNAITFAVANDVVELKNYGWADQRLDGWVVATAPDDHGRSYAYQFPAGTRIRLQSCLRLHWLADDDCPPGALCGIGGWTNDLTSIGGDLAVFRANDVDCEDAMVDYVRWGEDEREGRSLESLASPRHWPLGDSVDTSPCGGGCTIYHDGSGENGRTHWFLDEDPTPGC